MVPIFLNMVTIGFDSLLEDSAKWYMKTPETKDRITEPKHGEQNLSRVVYLALFQAIASFASHHVKLSQTK
jgi:hypothetical protein